MVVKDTAKSLKRIFVNLICQLLGEISDIKIKDLAKLEVQQILVKAEHQAKSREMQHAPCTNSFNVTPRYGLMPPSQSYSSSIQSPTFNKKQCYYQVILGKKQFSRVVMVYCIFFLLLQFQLQYQCIFNRFFETKMLLLIVDLFFPFNKLF